MAATEAAVPPQADTPPTEEKKDHKKAKTDKLFFQSLKEYPAAEWERQLMLRLYRLAPITDMGLKGEKVNYVAKYTQPIDEETVKQDHGSGEYRFLLNRLAPNKDYTIDQFEFKIFDMAHPPKIPPEIWINDSRNERWASMMKKETPGASGAPQQGLSADDVLKIVDRVVQRAQPKSDEDKDVLVKAVISALEQGHKSSIDMLVAQQKESSPSSFATMVTAIKGILPEPKSDNGVLEKIIQMQADHHKAELTLMEKIIDAKSEKPDTTEGTLTKTIVQKFLERGLEGGGGKEDWRTILAGSLPEVFREIRTTVQAIPWGMPGPAGNPAASRSPATAGQQQQVQQQQPQQVQRMNPFIVQALLTHFNESDGHAFAEWIIAASNYAQYKMMASAGRERILETVRAHPELAAICESAPDDVSRFIDEFIEGPLPDVPDDDVPEEPLPPGAAGTAKPRARKGKVN